jgi:hypothetical protein
VLLLLPERGLEGSPLLIDGERVVGEAHATAESRVVEAPQSVRQAPAQSGDSQRAHCVPDAHEVDRAVVVGVHPPEDPRLDSVRATVVVAAAIELVGVLDLSHLLGSQDARVANQADGAAGRERAAAEAEEVELVAGLVVLDQEAIAVANVAGEAETQSTAADALEALGADAVVVVQELPRATAVLRRHPEGELGDVGGGDHTAAELIGAVPRAIAAHDEALGHTP